MKPELIPHSNATNAYDLLADVIKAVEEEPKRLDMCCIIEDLDMPWAKANARPACGTMGCVAGWTMLLKGQRTMMADCTKASMMLAGIDIEEYCEEDGEDELGEDLYDLFFEGFPDHDLVGTPAYVAHVVERIREFMRKHEAALRMKAVPA